MNELWTSYGRGADPGLRWLTVACRASPATLHRHASTDGRIEATISGPEHLVISGHDELEAIGPSWDALGGSFDGPTNSHAWALAYAGALPPRERLHVVSVGPPDAPVAIAPLVRQVPFGQLRWVGDRLGEPMDVRWADPAALRLLADALAASGAALTLHRVPAGSPTIDALSAGYGGRGLVRRRPAVGSPVIALDESWAEPQRKFNSGRRSDFRRALRRAGEQGEVTFEILTPSPGELGPLLDEAFAVEAAGWKGAKGTALRQDPVVGRFFSTYSAAAAKEGILRLCFMRIGGRAVATQLAVEYAGRFWLLKIGYDESLARCSPGTLLMLHTLGDAATRGLASYEFLGSEAPWTAMWTSEVRATATVGAYPPRPAAAAALAADAVELARALAIRRLRR